MSFSFYSYRNEDDFWRIRNFLREVFLLNDRLEYSWHVARMDYWRWHFIMNCHFCESIEKVTSIWEDQHGKIVAVMNPIGMGEIRLHILPEKSSPMLVNEMLAHAEEQLFEETQPGRKIVYTPVFTEDAQRQQILSQRGYKKLQGKSYHWHRDIDTPIPDVKISDGYTIRSMGSMDEHATRSWASWKAFHADEGDENYDGDWSWYQNIQSAPLYRRDLDIVAVSPQGDIASFCTIFYDDSTRSAVCVLVGTAAEHQRRGLGKSVILEGMRRLKKMGCTRVFASAFDVPAGALYGSVMQTSRIAETWLKELSG